MNIRFLKVALFLVATLSANAYAGGWVYIAGMRVWVGSIHIELDLRGVPNPSTKPTIAIVDGVLDEIEYLCRNPNDYSVAPGSSGQRTIYGTDVLDSGNIVGKGQATVELVFDVPGPFTCVNPNWTWVEGSEVAKKITATISTYLCTGDPRTDPDPCYEGNTLTIAETPADTRVIACTLDPVLRNYDGTVTEGQFYTCTQTSP